MKNVFDEFPMTRIINLRERKDRRRATEKEFEKIGIKIDGEKIDFFTTDRFSEPAGFPTTGVRGCFTSHLSILQQAQRVGHDRVLILEDDIAFNKPEVESLDLITSQLNEKDWDIVYFGYLEPNHASLSSHDGLIAYNGPTLGGQFYAVREPYLRIMASFMESCTTRPAGDPEGGPMFRDGVYNFYRERHLDLKQFVCAPNLGGQRRSRTNLHRLNWYDRTPIIRDLVEFGRNSLN